MQDFESTLDAALYYSSLGWSIFPVYGASDPAQAKRPVIEEVPHWHQDSTSDPKQIIAWYTGTKYGIGLDCGKSGVFVLDGDRLEAVPSSLNLENAWSMRGNPERQSWMYKQPEDSPIGCSPGGWEAGEIKGDGGYVVLPPSFHPVGGTYTWIDRSGSMAANEEVLSMLQVATRVETNKLFFATPGEPCSVLKKVLNKQLALIQEAARQGTGRYLATNRAVYAIAALGSEGHRGSSEGLKQIREAFYRTHGSDGSDRALRAEWGKTLSGLAVKLSGRTPKPCGGSSCDLHDIEYEIHQKVQSYRIAAEAKRRIELDSFQEWSPVPTCSLGELTRQVGNPDRIKNLLNVDGVCLLVAQRKTGKTTFISNLIHSLCDEEPLFDLFETTYPSKGCIGLFDLEMTKPLLGEWLSRLHIQNQSRLKVFPCRGNITRTFSMLLTNPEIFSDWLKHNNLSTLIIDPIGPLLAGLGMDENSNSEIRRLFTLIREVSTQAGIGEIILTHHAGWGSTNRARGASAFEDMVDVIWRLEADKEGNRFFSTLGRLGNISATKLEFDPSTGLLSLGESLQSLNI